MILLIGELDERDMRIYIKISLAGFCVTRTSLNIGVSFKTIKPVKNWEKTPHFMFGNLLCLSPTGNFKLKLIRKLKHKFNPSAKKDFRRVKDF